MEAQLDLLDYAAAVKNRDAAIAQVADNAQEWMAVALIQLRQSIHHFPAEFLAETIRHEIAPLVGHPHKHNAWGALTQRAIKEKILIPTGAYRTTLSKKTHGHRTAVYRRGDHA